MPRTERIMQSANEIRHYEELPGQNGRTINFRAERVKARALFPKIRPELEIGAEPLGLENLSLSGMAALTDRRAEWSKDAGSSVEIRLTLADSVFYEGCGEVRWFEETPFGTKIGLRFESGAMDIAAYSELASSESGEAPAPSSRSAAVSLCTDESSP